MNISGMILGIGTRGRRSRPRKVGSGANLATAVHGSTHKGPFVVRPKSNGSVGPLGKKPRKEATDHMCQQTVQRHAHISQTSRLDPLGFQPKTRSKVYSRSLMQGIRGNVSATGAVTRPTVGPTYVEAGCYSLLPANGSLAASPSQAPTLLCEGKQRGFLLVGS